MEATGRREGILFLDEINCVSETLTPAMLQFLQYKDVYKRQLRTARLLRGRALGFSLPCMSGLAAFSCHDNIRPIALEGSRWGDGYKRQHPGRPSSQRPGRGARHRGQSYPSSLRCR